MIIEFEIEQIDDRVVTMSRLKTHCTCWGPWFKD